MARSGGCALRERLYGPKRSADLDGEYVDSSEGYVTDVITDNALTFLEQQRDAQAPFYLSVHYTAPHSPWTGHPQAIVDSYDDCPFHSCPQEPIHPWARGLTEQNLDKRESLQGYFAAVTAMDANVGRLLDRLEARAQSNITRYTTELRRQGYGESLLAEHGQ